MRCPHCGKKIEAKHLHLTWMRIKGKAQSIEKVTYLGRPGKRWFEKTSGPKLIYVMDKE